MRPGVRRALKPICFLLLSLPAVLLASRAVAGGLGANPIERVTRDTGEAALQCLLFTLSLTPLRRWTGINELISLRRMAGLFAFSYAVAHLLTYVVLDQFFDWNAITGDLTKRPFIMAGAASLAKVVLSLQADTLPPSINYTGPNPYIDFAAAHLQVIPEQTDWPRYSGSAVAGVSGFGFGGTNAHVVVQEYRPASHPGVSDPVTVDSAGSDSVTADDAPAAPAAGIAGAPPLLLAVSGYVPSRLRRTAAELADWLETEAGSAAPLADVARSLARRSHGRTRSVVLANTHAEAITGLRAVAAGKAHPSVVGATAPDDYSRI